MPLDISEYRSLPNNNNTLQAPTGVEPAEVFQQVAIGAGSVPSNPLGAYTQLVRLHADVNCRFAVGLNPVAGPLTPRLSAGATEYFNVQPGHRIAVIASS
jgi:hypothetical protein